MRFALSISTAIVFALTASALPWPKPFEHKARGEVWYGADGNTGPQKRSPELSDREVTWEIIEGGDIPSKKRSPELSDREVTWELVEGGDIPSKKRSPELSDREVTWELVEGGDVPSKKRSLVSSIRSLLS